MHEQITKEFDKMNICMSRFGVRIGWGKYLYECTPFGYVNLWNLLYLCSLFLVTNNQSKGQNGSKGVEFLSTAYLKKRFIFQVFCPLKDYLLVVLDL